MPETADGDHLPPFGEEAHRILARARAAAHRLRHTSLGTEDVLIGCVEEARGQAAELLYRAGISLTDVMDRVKLLDAPTGEQPQELALAPGLRSTLRFAREEAERLRDGEVRSEHLLLAILRERTSGGAVVLRATGLDSLMVRAALTRQRHGTPARAPRVPWIAAGPYRALALLGGAAVLSAVAATVRWFVSVRPALRSAYLFDLLIPIALLSIGMVCLGASRIEALRQAVAREAQLAWWIACGPAAQVSAALERARSGQLADAARSLEAAADRQMPDAEVRAALTALSRWIADEQLAPYGLFARGLLRVHSGQTQAGLTDLESAVRCRPDEAHWQDLYGLWLARARRDEAASPLLRTASQRQPPDPRAVMEYAALLLRLGDPRQAEPHARYATKALPAASRPLALLAATQSFLGAPAEAAATLRQSLALDPYDSLAQALCAVLLLREGSAAEALSVLRDATAATVAPPAYLAALEGWAFASLGHEQEARLTFAQVREIEPLFVGILQRMALGLQAGNFHQAAREVSSLTERLAS